MRVRTALLARALHWAFALTGDHEPRLYYALPYCVGGGAAPRASLGVVMNRLVVPPAK